MGGKYMEDSATFFFWASTYPFPLMTVMYLYITCVYNIFSKVCEAFPQIIKP